MRKPRLSIGFVALVVLTCLIMGLPSIATASPLGIGGPPGDAGGSFDVPAGGALGCEQFAVRIDLAGKSKSISLGGFTIFTSPGMHTTITNLTDTSKSVTLNITGSFHDTTDENGVTREKFAGRNLVWDETTGTMLLAGNYYWEYRYDAAGNLEVVTHLTAVGAGQMLDVCAMIG
jgi:hypothetical protein